MDVTGGTGLRLKRGWFTMFHRVLPSTVKHKDEARYFLPVTKDFFDRHGFDSSLLDYEFEVEEGDTLQVLPESAKAGPVVPVVLWHGTEYGIGVSTKRFKTYRVGKELFVKGEDL